MGGADAADLSIQKALRCAVRVAQGKERDLDGRRTRIEDEHVHPVQDLRLPFNLRPRWLQIRDMLGWMRTGERGRLPDENASERGDSLSLPRPDGLAIVRRTLELQVRGEGEQWIPLMLLSLQQNCVCLRKGQSRFGERN